ERHHRHWARPQHLWLAERAADLALLSAVDERDDPRLPARALELLQAYEGLYPALPNRDNVLGPSHLFFSTYLESLWLTSYLAAAFLLLEGENYHLVALRGLMQGMHWARTAGFDLLDAPEIRLHFRSALLAPARSALPDFTFPARRDSRYGVSLAQPAYLELWEVGRSWLG